MFEKFKDDENVFLNNYALGETKGEKNLIFLRKLELHLLIKLIKTQNGLK